MANQFNGVDISLLMQQHNNDYTYIAFPTFRSSINNYEDDATEINQCYISARSPIEHGIDFCGKTLLILEDGEIDKENSYIFCTGKKNVIILKYGEFGIQIYNSKNRKFTSFKNKEINLNDYICYNNNNELRLLQLQTKNFWKISKDTSADQDFILNNYPQFKSNVFTFEIISCNSTSTSSTVQVEATGNNKTIKFNFVKHYIDNPLENANIGKNYFDNFAYSAYSITPVEGGDINYDKRAYLPTYPDYDLLTGDNANYSYCHEDHIFKFRIDGEEIQCCVDYSQMLFSQETKIILPRTDDDGSTSGNFIEKKKARLDKLIVSLNDSNKDLHEFKEGFVPLYNFYNFCNHWDNYYMYKPVDKLSYLKEGNYKFKCYNKSKEEIPGSVHLLPINHDFCAYDRNISVTSGHTIKLTSGISYNDDWISRETKLNKIDDEIIKYQEHYDKWKLNPDKYMLNPDNFDNQIIYIYNHITTDDICSDYKYRDYQYDFDLIHNPTTPDEKYRNLGGKEFYFKPKNDIYTYSSSVLINNEYRTIYAELEYDRIRIYLEKGGQVNGYPIFSGRASTALKQTGIHTLESYFLTIKNEVTDSSLYAEQQINVVVYSSQDLICITIPQILIPETLIDNDFSTGSTPSYPTPSTKSVCRRNKDGIIYEQFYFTGEYLDYNAPVVSSNGVRNPAYTLKNQYTNIYDTFDLNISIIPGKFKVKLIFYDKQRTSLYYIRTQIEFDLYYQYGNQQYGNDGKYTNQGVEDCKITHFDAGDQWDNDLKATIKYPTNIYWRYEKISDQYIVYMKIGSVQISNGNEEEITISSTSQTAFTAVNRNITPVLTNQTQSDEITINGGIELIYYDYDYYRNEDWVYKQITSNLNIKKQVSVYALFIDDYKDYDDYTNITIGIQINNYSTRSSLCYYFKYRQIDNASNVTASVEFTPTSQSEPIQLGEQEITIDKLNYSINENKVKYYIEFNETSITLPTAEYKSIGNLASDFFEVTEDNSSLKGEASVEKFGIEHTIKVVTNPSSKTTEITLNDEFIYKHNDETNKWKLYQLTAGGENIYIADVTVDASVQQIEGTTQYIINNIPLYELDYSSNSQEGEDNPEDNPTDDVNQPSVEIKLPNNYDIVETNVDLIRILSQAFEYRIKQLNKSKAEMQDGYYYKLLKNLDNSIDPENDWIGEIRFIPNDTDYLNDDLYIAEKPLTLSVIHVDEIKQLDQIQYYNSKNEYVQCNQTKNFYLGSKESNLKTFIEQGVNLIFKATYNSPYYVECKTNEIKSNHLYPILWQCNNNDDSVTFDTFTESYLGNYNLTEYDNKLYFKYVAGVCEEDRVGDDSSIATTLCIFSNDKGYYQQQAWTHHEVNKERNVSIKEQKDLSNIDNINYLPLLPTYLYRSGEDSDALTTSDANGYSITIPKNPNDFSINYDLSMSLGHVENSKIYPGSTWNKTLKEWTGDYISVITNLYRAYECKDKSSYVSNYAYYKNYSTTYYKDILISVSPRSVDDCNKYLTIRDFNYVEWLDELNKYRKDKTNKDSNTNIKVLGTLKNFPLVFNFKYKLPNIDTSIKGNPKDVIHTIYGTDYETPISTTTEKLYTLDGNGDPIVASAHPKIPKCDYNKFKIVENKKVIYDDSKPSKILDITGMVIDNPISLSDNLSIHFNNFGTYDIHTTKHLDGWLKSCNEYLTGLPKNHEFIK